MSSLSTSSSSSLSTFIIIFVNFLLLLIILTTLHHRRKGQRYELVNVLSPGKCLQVLELTNCLPRRRSKKTPLHKKRCWKIFNILPPQSAGLLPAPRGWAGQSESDIPAQLFPKHVQVPWPLAQIEHGFGDQPHQCSYLSQKSQIIFVEKKLSCGEILGNFGRFCHN